MKIKIISERKDKELDEMSSAGGVAGFPGGIGVQNRAPNREKDSEEEEILGEMFSTSASIHGAARDLSSDDDQKVFDGQKERAKMQGLKNFDIDEEEIVEEVFKYFHSLLTNPRK